VQPVEEQTENIQPRGIQTPFRGVFCASDKYNDQIHQSSKTNNYDMDSCQRPVTAKACSEKMIKKINLKLLIFNICLILQNCKPKNQLTSNTITNLFIL